MDIVQEVERLKLPHGSYALMSGGVLALHGWRIPTDEDVDILASSVLLGRFYTLSWTHEFIGYGTVKFKRANIRIYSDFHVLGYQPSTRDLLARAEMVQGISCVSLADLLAYRRALWLAYGKHKNKIDIQLLERKIREREIETPAVG